MTSAVRTLPSARVTPFAMPPCTSIFSMVVPSSIWTPCLKNFARFQDSSSPRKDTHCCYIRGATSGSVRDLAYVTARNPGRGSPPRRLEFYSNHSKVSSDRRPPHSGQPRPTSAVSCFGVPNNRHCRCVCTLRAERDVRGKTMGSEGAAISPGVSRPCCGWIWRELRTVASRQSMEGGFSNFGAEFLSNSQP